MDTFRTQATTWRWDELIRGCGGRPASPRESFQPHVAVRKTGEVVSQANCASESIGPCSAFCVPGRAKKDDHRRELHPYHQTDRRGQPAVDRSILCLPNVNSKQ